MKIADVEDGWHDLKSFQEDWMGNVLHEHWICWMKSVPIYKTVKAVFKIISETCQTEAQFCQKFIYSKERKLAGPTPVLPVRVRGPALILKTGKVPQSAHNIKDPIAHPQASKHHVLTLQSQLDSRLRSLLAFWASPILLTPHWFCVHDSSLWPCHWRRNSRMCYIRPNCDWLTAIWQQIAVLPTCIHLGPFSVSYSE